MSEIRIRIDDVMNDIQTNGENSQYYNKQFNVRYGLGQYIEDEKDDDNNIIFLGKNITINPKNPKKQYDFIDEIGKDYHLSGEDVIQTVYLIPVSTGGKSRRRRTKRTKKAKKSKKANKSQKRRR